MSKYAPFYKKQTCVVCKAIYDAWTKHQETCSVSCKAKLMHQRRKEKLGKPKNCAHCGHEWIAMPKDTRKFCSWECHAADKGHRGIKHAECEQCGNKFDTYRHNPEKDGHGRFCSRTCWFEFAKKRQSLTCECCGINFEVWDSNASQRFCSKNCEHAFLSGERHHLWRGKEYESISSKGWVMVRAPWTKKLIPKHRVVASQYIGRRISKWEIVIHIDGIRTHNDPSNLYLFHSRSDWVKVQVGGTPWPSRSNLDSIKNQQ